MGLKYAPILGWFKGLSQLPSETSQDFTPKRKFIPTHLPDNELSSLSEYEYCLALPVAGVYLKKSDSRKGFSQEIHIMMTPAELG